ncbi:S-layer homology domain-containing protein [Peptoniphilus sp. Marseille-Q6390]
MTSTDENKYEIQYADGEAKKWAYNNFDKVGKDITTDTTFTAQVIEFGKPTVTFPDVEIEKGGSKVVTPEVKDKYNKKIENPGKPEVNEKPNGVTVTPNDDGTVKIEVPKDYTGSGTFTIKVTYKIDGKDVPGVITVKIKEDKKPEPKPEPVPEVEIPGIKYKDHYTPTYPVYVSVPDKVIPEFFTHEQYIFGYPDDTIRPDGDMTRAEAIAVVARLQKLDLSDKTSNIYKDTKAGMWYNAAINAAFREGYLLEKEGENIRPNDKITRAELALLISHIDKKNDKVAPFEDVKGHKFEAAINQAYGNERIKGYPDGTFKPDNSITRAEVATMLNKLYDRYPDKNFIDANQNLVHNYKDMSYKGHWGYYELVEAYHTHKFARLANNMEEWKAIIK